MLNRARIAVLVSGGGTNLQALLDAQRAGALPHGEICVVISSRAEAYALRRGACESPACASKAAGPGPGPG